MQIILIYAVALGGVITLLLLWRVFLLAGDETRGAVFSFLRKKISYTLIYRRRASSDNISIPSLLNILLFLAANITVCTFKIHDRTELAQRCGALSLINIVPLFLGGQTSFLADLILRLPLGQRSVIHRWLGRICVLQGLVHGVLNATKRSRMTNAQLLLIFLTGAIGAFSILYIRHYMYEVFIKTHLVFALSIAGALWFHVPLSNKRALICLVLGCGLWVLQNAFWLFRLGYRNFGAKPHKWITFTPYASTPGSPQAVAVTIALQKPWKVSAGQYLYLTLPSVARHRGGFIQAHPYNIAWASGSDVFLIIQKGGGFSSDIINAVSSPRSAIIDGPYGHCQSFKRYDRVLFVAAGIGITSHLLTIKDLLEAHKDQTARVRRVTLFWFIETADQEQWALHFLHRLRALDDSHIFTIALFVPPATTSSDPYVKRSERWLRTDQPLKFSHYIELEGKQEAGTMAVSVCGPSHFEDAVRRVVLRSKHDIYLSHSAFHPEDSEVSRASQVRYSCTPCTAACAECSMEADSTVLLSKD